MQWLNRMDDEFCLKEIIFKKTKRGVSKRKSTYADKNYQTLFLQSTGLVELKERGFIGNGELRLLVGLVVQFEGLVGVRIILLGLLFDFVLRFNPVKEFPSFSFVFGVGGSVSLKSFVMSFFLRGRPLDHSQKEKGQDNHAFITAPPAIIATSAMLHTIPSFGRIF